MGRDKLGVGAGYGYSTRAIGRCSGRCMCGRSLGMGKG